MEVTPGIGVECADRLLPLREYRARAGARPFDEMLRDARIRACYQHPALKYVMSEPMTNRSLRERFGLSETKSASISQVIAATIYEKLIKPDETAGDSRHMARYLPFWA